jgi:hypothetical protein
MIDLEIVIEKLKGIHLQLEISLKLITRTYLKTGKD